TPPTDSTADDLIT
ncbi:hypothetical protein A4X03_0g6999, partial [Tilletia caries]